VLYRDETHFSRQEAHFLVRKVEILLEGRQLCFGQLRSHLAHSNQFMGDDCCRRMKIHERTEQKQKERYTESRYASSKANMVSLMHQSSPS